MTPPFAGFPTSDCWGTLHIDGIAMQRPAWNVQLGALLGTPEIRGTNRVLPGVNGVRAYPKRVTETRYSLPWLLTGQFTRTGVRVAGDETDWAAAFAATLAWLNDNLLLPTGIGDGTRAATWTPPGQPVVTADVHVLSLPEPEALQRGFYRTTLELSVPGGDLHL